MNVSVSWLMPAYNAEKYISRAIDSILNQTMQDFEIIIILEPDCRDRTEEICNLYAKHDDRFVIIKNNNRLGVAKSLNKGLEVALGKYIARMDADDYSYPNRLEKQVCFLENNQDVGILCTNRRVICDNGITYLSNHPTDLETISARLLFGFCLNHPSMMFRKDLFKEKGWKYPEELEAEDFGLCSELIKYTKIACLEDVLIDYYEHGNNAIYEKFDAVRKASAIISKKAISTRLLIDNIDEYDDIYFGWRELDCPKGDYIDYLTIGYRLFKEISDANKKLQKINEKQFDEEINRQWKMTVSTVKLDFLMPNLDFESIADEIHLRKILDDTYEKYYNIFSCKKNILVWGAGGHAKSMLEPLENNYSFKIIGFIDSQKKESDFLGFKVYTPDMIDSIDWDYICIASYWGKEEIFKELKEKFKIESNKIFLLPDTEIMQLMADKFRNIKTINKKQAYIFMAPDYGNLGDHAILMAEKDFLADNGYAVHEFPADNFEEYLHLTQFTTRSDDLIIITGGGFLGSLWYNHQENLERTVRIHRHNRIIIFPQTIYWDDNTKLKESVSVFEDADDLTICARDTYSYSLMKSIYNKCKIILAPDMALYKEWNLNRSEYKRQGVLFCFKEDKESILSDEVKYNIYQLTKEIFEIIKESNTDIGVPIDVNKREKEVNLKLNEFCEAELVITDRLHGMIFSAITETPCIVLNNCNHKLKMTYNWLKELPYVRFVDNNLITRKMIEEIIAQPCEYKFDKEYFKELKNCL